MDDRTIKAEPGVREDVSMTNTKPSYKSWKKKYRKMRLHFDMRMQQSEELHRLEQKAMRTMKRLAVENDRLMDLLLDINESPQIPLERRIDLSLDDEEDEDVEAKDPAQQPTKSLRHLIEEVRHRDFEATAEHLPEILEQIQPKDPELYPTSFLTAEDVDNYLADIDMRIGLKTKPTIAKPEQTTPNTSAANFALHNPTSVYNWLRKHAPKTFLQDMEKDKEKDNDHGEKGEGGGRRKMAGTRGTKRQSAATRKEVAAAAAVAAAAEPMEWDEEAAFDVSATGTVRGKRKRDDDGGYRPKGGASRAAKKRKSEPRARKSTS
ncbi:IEC3 subunit of the Ino80 complex, chromatin re-modelling-domain-containing protein [Pseudomassariella vexata]|uniref:IEC3 subunit of the Ino80 complex, chromatin re-modelling-domain-containing protein n=1 Tax=Pseudomassariella vexata TaxID=1141098 RepID=A0A1Y2E0Q3_9PEZI|nr:IEC3 subunit of the Ino80 complex, chromatin re-modelling-domain-containing protein [Pseudomassariella vexata]ORY64926.1 IEC3 subunit of the Ino80 complex, chromatin re-modelling-domain-containing protein [Pseudomassariella vexata]